MYQPSVNMLAHRGQHEAEKPAGPASGASLQEMEVILFSFDRAFSAGASVLMEEPEGAVSGNEGPDWLSIT